MNKYLLFFIIVSIIIPFIFLKDSYPFHRFGMFAEPIKYKRQYEKFYIFYQLAPSSVLSSTSSPAPSSTLTTNFVELKAQEIPINANAFEMQLRKFHYQKKHSEFIAVFDKIIKDKLKLKTAQKLNWKWYQVIQNEDSICVFSN